jgi:hypothetical protein
LVHIHIHVIMNDAVAQTDHGISGG